MVSAKKSSYVPPEEVPVQRQGELLQLRIHRQWREQAFLYARQGRLAVFIEAVGVGLGTLSRSTYQRAGVAEEAAVESRPLFQQRVGERQFPRPPASIGDLRG